MKRRYLSFFLTLTMMFAVMIGFAIPAQAALLPYNATLTITPDKTEIDVTTGAVDIIYTLKVTPPEGQYIGVFSFELKAPEGMTLTTTSTTSRDGDGYWLNRAELWYVDGVYEDGYFGHLSYTPLPNGYFLASETTPERKMQNEADIMTIKATITDASKAGSYALAALYPNVGPDGTDKFSFDIVSNPVVVKVGPADKSALTAAIAGVNYVAVSIDGSDVESTDKWTTQAAKEALENAEADAQAVVDNADATQEEVDDAVDALAEAVSAYATAQQYGTKPAPLDKSALIAAIADAEGAKEGVAVSADGTDVPMGDKWVTQAALDALNNAIEEAEEALEDAVTQADIDNAASDLNEAIDLFNSSVGFGTKAKQITLNNIMGLKPVRGATAVSSINTNQYTGTVTWDPVVAVGKNFAASTVYYAQITITPKVGWTLEGLDDNFFTVADADEVVYSGNPGSFEAVFPKTAAASTGGGGGGGGGVIAPTVTGIEIKAAPDKVSYNEGDKLDLTGLAVTLTYSDGTSKDIALEDFSKNDITVSPKDGDVLDADIKAIEIKANGKTAKQVIVVEKKDIVTPPDIDQPDEKPVLNDIDGHWAQDKIDYLVGIGAISGYPDGTFKPDAPITRAEFAKVIVDAFELKGTGKVFEDTADHWAKNYIAIAAANGIVLGYNENEFGPDDLITREQMAIIIVKAAGLAEETGVLDFIDEGNVSSWAYNWVVSAVENNLMSGYEDNSFKPLNNATRAEAVTVIYNVLMK